MKKTIYVGHAKKLSFVDELYEPLRSSSLNDRYNIILPHEKYEHAQDFVTKDIIASADLVIAEVSHPATGLGIELGIASIYQRPILCIYKKGAQISGSLSVICNDFLEYENREDMIVLLEERVGEILGNK